MRFTTKEIKRLMGKAIHDRQMIKDGDHVMVAVSGGKDSLSLLWLLNERLKRVPIEYKITAVHVDPGFGGNSAEKLASFFSSAGLDSHIIKSRIGITAHGPDNRENPCFLCSHLRRKRLFETSGKIGCNRIALGHHKDDVIETLFLNIFYGASISTMKPVQPLFDGKLTLIRPLFMTDEDLIRRFADDMGWPDIQLGCPTQGASKRVEIKNILQTLYRNNKKVKGNIFHALQNVNSDYLL